MQAMTSPLVVTSASSFPPLTRGLPFELLERVLLFTSACDILRLPLVGNTTEDIRICEFADCSNLERLIVLLVVMYATLLRSNMRSITSPSDRNGAHGRKHLLIALPAHRRRWDTLDPAGEWDRVLRVSSVRGAILVSGTYGIL
jgi:hypothetical protein